MSDEEEIDIIRLGDFPHEIKSEQILQRMQIPHTDMRIRFHRGSIDLRVNGQTKNFSDISELLNEIKNLKEVHDKGIKTRSTRVKIKGKKEA